MKVYVGKRESNNESGMEARVYVQDSDGKNRRLLQQLFYHSPTGFEWGYGGSGPADLAIAILADFFGETETMPSYVMRKYHPKNHVLIEQTRAWRLHQEFKWAVIANQPNGGFRIDEDDIREWLKSVEAKP